MNAPIAHKPPAGWIVTFHAAERYCARVDKSMTPLAAMIAMRELLPDATLQAEPTALGQQRWLLPGVDAVVVAKPDPRVGAHVAVTVLGPHEMYEVEAIPEVVAAYRRATTPRIVTKPVPVATKTTKAVAPKAVKSGSPTPLELEWNAQLSNLRTKVANLQSHIDQTQGKVAEWKERALAAEKKAIESSKEMSTRQKRHIATVIAESVKRREMLRIAVTALRAAGNTEALAALEAIDAGITSDHFCYPERFTNEEREAAGAARRKEQIT